MEDSNPISFVEGAVYDLGSASLSEQEIIDYARTHDPLEFHLSLEAAEKSLFKGLFASGPQIYHYFHKNRWVPIFGKTVMIGLGIDNWRFIRPVYADAKVFCTATIKTVEPNKMKGLANIRWLWEYTNEEGELLQHMDVLVLHKVL